MSTYIVKRLFAVIPTLLLTSLIVFSLIHMLPGDVIDTKLADSASAGPEEVARLRAKYGLDRPLPIQYLSWLSGFITGDLGVSTYTGEAIGSALRRSAPVTFQLGLFSVAISIGIGLPLGLISAIARNSPWDNVLRMFSILGLSAPEFWTGTMALTFLAIWFAWVPPTGYHTFLQDPWPTFEQLAIPALLVGYRLSAVIIRMTRSAVLEVIGEDYVRTARAKGLGARAVWVKHVLRNAMLPVMTIIGGQMLVLLGGTVIIETIFALPGMGRLLFDAITFRDYPLVQSIVFLFALAVVSINVLVDMTYALLDPRIRYV